MRQEIQAPNNEGLLRAHISKNHNPHTEAPGPDLRCDKILIEVHTRPIRLEKLHFKPAKQRGNRGQHFCIRQLHTKTHTIAAAEGHHEARQLLHTVWAFRVSQPSLWLISVAVWEDGLGVMLVEVVEGDGGTRGDGVFSVVERLIVGDAR